MEKMAAVRSKTSLMPMYDLMYDAIAIRSHAGKDSSAHLGIARRGWRPHSHNFGATFPVSPAESTGAGRHGPHSPRPAYASSSKDHLCQRHRLSTPAPLRPRPIPTGYRACYRSVPANDEVFHRTVRAALGVARGVAH